MLCQAASGTQRLVLRLPVYLLYPALRRALQAAQHLL
jgi:hypothetical protein